MKKIVVFILSFVLVTSCITFEEKYHFNKDGSGTMEYLIDLSELKVLLDMSSDDAESEDMDFKNEFKATADLLIEVEGISNVELTGDIDNFVMGIRYDFENIDALNSAMNRLINESATEDHIFIKKKKKVYTRTYRISEEFTNAIKNEDLGEEEGEELLRNMKYKVSMTFVRPVKKVSTEGNLVIKDDENTVILENNFKEILANPEIMNLTVKTK